MEHPGVDFSLLPEGCLAHILSFTSPADACRLSVVSPAFRSAAESDALWKSFFPSDYQSLLSRSSSSSSSTSLSKKALFFHLCNYPVLIDDGFKSFYLDKWTGKKCYTLAASDLYIVWGGTCDYYWTWKSLPEARLWKVAFLKSVCWLEIRGKIHTDMLTPGTKYGAYLVFKLSKKSCHGFKVWPVDVSVGITGLEKHKRMVCLDPSLEEEEDNEWWYHQIYDDHDALLGFQCPNEREDGWLEIELGEYFVDKDESGELEMDAMETTSGNWKDGLIVLGIDIRPKDDHR